MTETHVTQTRTEGSSAKRRLLSREKAFDSSCSDLPGVPGHLQFQRRHAGCTGISPLRRIKVLFSVSSLLSAGRFLMRGMHLSTYLLFPPSLMARPASKLDVNCQTARAGCVCCHVRLAIGRVYHLWSLGCSSALWYYGVLHNCSTRRRPSETPCCKSAGQVDPKLSLN